MIFEEDYWEAKRALAELEDEARCLEINLTSAVQSENVEEVARLKGRAKDLPFELFTAETWLIRAEIEMLEGEQQENYLKLSSAKKDLGGFDLQVTPQIQNLQKEVSRLQRIAFGKAAAISVAEAEIRAKNNQIASAKKRLEKLMLRNC